MLSAARLFMCTWKEELADFNTVKEKFGYVPGDL